MNISDCFTGRLKEDVPPAIEAFGKVLAQKPNLRIIDFSDNAFSPAGATALSHFLANCTSLEELRLNNNGLGPDGGKIIAKGLKENRLKTKAAGKPSVLRLVTIGRNRLENGSANELAEAFSLHENLEEVALFQNGIRPEGIVSLAQGLSKCLKLKSLDLQDNTFTAKGSKAVAAAIPCWLELNRLNIGDCLLSDEGCRLILEKLVNSPAASKLLVLNLQYAEMEGETAKYFASNLSVFSSLEKLFLNGNSFAPEGAEVKALRAALKDSTTLDDLDDMDFDEEENEESEEEKEEIKVKIEHQIPSTPSPKFPVDEVSDVTEIIGTLKISEAEAEADAEDDVEVKDETSHDVEMKVSETDAVDNFETETEVTESTETPEVVTETENLVSKNSESDQNLSEKNNNDNENNKV